MQVCTRRPRQPSPSWCKWEYRCELVLLFRAPAQVQRRPGVSPDGPWNPGWGGVWGSVARAMQGDSKGGGFSVLVTSPNPPGGIRVSGSVCDSGMEFGEQMAGAPLVTFLSPLRAAFAICGIANDTPATSTRPQVRTTSRLVISPLPRTTALSLLGLRQSEKGPQAPSDEHREHER